MNLPPPGAVCIDDGCARPAQTERPLGVNSNGVLMTEWVCDGHREGGSK